MKQEIEVHRIDSKQKYNLIKDTNTHIRRKEELSQLRTIQLNEFQTQTQNVQSMKENTLTQEIEQSDEPVSIENKDENNLLQSADIIFNSDSYQNIKSVSLEPLESTEPAEDPECISSSRETPVKSTNSTLPLTPKVDSWESKEEKNEVDQALFQPNTAEIENQNETTLPTQPKSELLLDYVDEIKLPSMVNVLTNEVSHTPIVSSARTSETISESLTIAVEIDNPEWSNKFSEHIIWLGQQEIKGAVIKINPEDLGPLEINIKVINDVASVNITTHNQNVREIIDQSLPKLQAMMAEQGLNLSEVQIDSDTGSRQSSQQNDGAQEHLMLEEEVGVTPLKTKRVIKGLVDYFA